MASKKRKSDQQPADNDGAADSSSAPDNKRARTISNEVAEAAGHDTSLWHKCGDSSIGCRNTQNALMKQLCAKAHAEPGQHTVPAEILYCKWFTQLFTPRSSVTFLPLDIGMCASLVSINIAYTDIAALPAELGKCHALEELYCRGAALTTAPPELANCKSLKWIDLSDTKVTTVPGEWGDSKSLVKIDLYGCPLTHLPVRLGKCETLETIVAPYNMRHLNPIFTEYLMPSLSIPAAMRVAMRDQDRNFKRALFSIPAKEAPHLMSLLPGDVKKYIYSFF
jgi:Leucine-rich repeat (LRR) protein